MPLLASTTILPGWVVLPVSVVVMLVVASHVLTTHASDLPLRRRRLRTVNGLLMMFVTALMAYALGVAAVIDDPTSRPQETRQFVIVWLAIVALVSVVVAIACVDALATVVHGWGVRKMLRREMRDGLRAEIAHRQLGMRTGGREQEPSRGRG